MKIDYTFVLVNTFDVVKMRCSGTHACLLKRMAGE